MHSEALLDFGSIRERLAEHCSSVIAKELAMQLEPMRDAVKIKEALDETVEAMQSLQTEIEQPLGGTRDIRSACAKSRKEIVLSREELWDIYTTLGAYRRMYTFFREKYAQYPLLTLWAQDIPSHEKLERRFERIFDKKGELMDSASPKLQHLRSTIVKTKERIKNDLQAILHDKDNQKYFQEAIVTQRNNRYVIPVKQEYRYAFEGLIHDRSATGATLYIEPMRLVNLNNDLQEAVMEEEQEVLRIYRELSGLVRQNSNTLMDACDRVSHIEFVYGKANLALAMKAVPAVLSGAREVNLIHARHPLIPANVVVPTTITLGTSYRILLITGSNTGGKTVALKTLGLLSLMNQAGLCIPAEAGSVLPIFNTIYADIGDEQSIEASLSTFSAHMTQVVSILKAVGSKDLVLLDELGSGTDPEEGSALAMAILEYFRKSGALLMVSTHYNELKRYAYDTDDIENGHVEFDERTLRPTYRLHIGVAGSSHALSIAARLGLPREVIDMAKANKDGSANRDMEAVLSDLNEQLRRTRERERALKKELEDTRRIKASVEREKKQMNERRKAILTKAQEEAQNLKRSIRIEGEQIIKELKSQFSEGDKQKRQDAITQARKSIAGVQIPEAPMDERRRIEAKEVAEGMPVFVDSLGQLGTVLAVQGKRVQVDVNGLTATVKLADLREASRQEAGNLRRKNEAPQPKARKRSGTAVLRQQQATTELNVIGQTVDEATVTVGRFIDQAILAGISPVRIVHGKGTGALRAGIQQYLKHLPQVKHYEIAGLDEGGAGATIVYLK
ncbi:endonuclease MutS2 [Veillonella magna]|uniref:Endonuclease MutS2 n=1 Tax=Veillonella magna TaxID=464322 RepID=A0ABS2GHA1_9FIRM|nr:endonuclease MutS2 [Veillonella magna]MBM6824926.1 endonuclease MutS2 [Veillonella magna]MBM6913220.1 endonuclease MutS2 [Veillonella magna]